MTASFLLQQSISEFPILLLNSKYRTGYNDEVGFIIFLNDPPKMVHIAETIL